ANPRRAQQAPRSALRHRAARSGGVIPPPVTIGSMAKERVLIVDDEEGVRNSLRNILKDEGYAVDVAESGERCLEMVRSAPYHAVFLDVWLKGRDGLSILEELLSQPLPPRVIMISGHADVPLAHRAGRLGAFDFIEKPLSLEKLAVTLRNAVADRT